jgi:hypothetical protein
VLDAGSDRIRQYRREALHLGRSIGRIDEAKRALLTTVWNLPIGPVRREMPELPDTPCESVRISCAIISNESRESGEAVA